MNNETHRCGAEAPIRQGDTGPVVCDKPAGHDLAHEGNDPDNRSYAFPNLRPRRNWYTQVACTEGST